SAMERISRTSGVLSVLAIAGIMIAVLLLGIFVVSGMIIVENRRCAVLIRKTGDDLPNGEILATGDQKGIQADTLPEGWYWRNPYTWDHVIRDQTEIPPNKVGLQIRTWGKPISENAVIAGPGERGIIADVLRPGRYVVNPFAYTVVLAPAVSIEPGHVGVLTLVSGADPKNPNEFLVENGERGIQKHTLPPGTYYENPYVKQITPIDIRSHRFDMMGDKIIRFPSLDGFDITMEGTIEWYIDPLRVSEVFSKYVEERDVITCITEAVILPNARAYSRIEGSKHLARDFIGGVTREKFQEEFLAGIKNSCSQQGVMIQSALIREIAPPDAIAKPIKDREIAIRMRDMYEQQKERERQQKLLAMEEKMKDRKTMSTQSDADASVAITKATQEKEVAVIAAERELAVAQLQLQAAQNQAQAIVAGGKAKSDVILFKNAAEAQGLKNAAAAFGDGHIYVRYLMNQKLAPSITYILANTDGPFADIIRRVLESSKAGKK
ncbi:MAG TPA: SPFH domain-containing protein, partial [Planctomycetota bacterium]|nr:SPFH domain-containing protein [Planctomycetota bacterium]